MTTKAEHNLFADLATVLKSNGGEASIELINRHTIHPTVKVVGSVAPKEKEDGIVIYVGRFKQPYFIPFSFNNGSGDFSSSNEGIKSNIDYSIDRSNWVNKMDFIDFANLKYIGNNHANRDINWCNPNFGTIIKNVVVAWNSYCAEGRTRYANDKNVNKMFPMLYLGYMSRKDGAVTSEGKVAGTDSIGHGHKSGTAIDMNFENRYENYDMVDDYSIQAVVKLFDICKSYGVLGIGYCVPDRYSSKLNDIYVRLGDHKDHFHVSATDRGKQSL